MDVAAFLKTHGLEAYVDAFLDNGVDAALLPELCNDDLKDLGIARLADRKRLLKAIERLSEADEPDVLSSPVAASAKGERRQVTVLFADIAGFTKLAGDLGAEQTHTLLNRYFETVDDIIEEFGGTVDKHMGDNVMAVFGAPTAHDDDAIRAVRASIEIHERLRDLSRDIGRELQAHIGLASGQVVASGTGSAAHREYTVTGDSVNLASRLQDKAKAGQTLISDALRRAVVDDIDCELLGDIAVKGIETPVPIWNLKGVRTREHRTARVAFVGRAFELAQFSSAIDASLASGRGQVIVVRGEAGIGKTRLVEECTVLAVKKGFEAHKGLVLDFGVGKGQDAVRYVVRSLLGVLPAANVETRQSSAQAAISSGMLAPDQMVFLNDLMDLPQSGDDRANYDAMDNEARNEGKRKVLADLILGVASKKPLIIVIEDVHWSNPLMLAHLATMAATVSDCPVLLVMTTRVEGDPLDQAWRLRAGGCSLMTIDLGPLRTEDALTLASAYIDSTNQFALDCIQRSEGNPLFLEQLLRSAEEVGNEEVPASIQSLVLSRLDRLSAEDKLSLQAASVLGQRFSLDALRHLIKDQSYTCDELLDRQLVRREGSDYLFAHALVQEGVYASLLTSHRAELHTDVAHWYGDRDPALRAQHLDRADDPSAAQAYLTAAQAQTDSLHFETALSLANRGIEIADDPDIRCDLMCLRGDVLRDIGRTEDSIAAFETAIDVAQDDIRRCRGRIGIANGLRITDRHQDALEVLDKAEQLASSNNFVFERAAIHYLRGNLYFPLGETKGCLEEHEKALRLYRETGSTHGEALALGGLGDAYYLRGHMRSASEQFATCVKVCKEHGYRRIEVANRHMVGWARIHLLEFAEALEDSLQASKLADEVSHHRAKVLSLGLAGVINLEQRNLPEAQAYLEQSLEVARTVGARNFEVQWLTYLARLYSVQGRAGEAVDLARKALCLARDVGMTFIGPSVLAVWASITHDPAERDKALQEAESILDSGCVAHNQFWFARDAIDILLESGAWDQVERLADRLALYTRAQPLPWPEFTISRGRALAAWGRGNRSPELTAELEQLANKAKRVGLMSAMPALERALRSA